MASASLSRQRSSARRLAALPGQTEDSQGSASSLLNPPRHTNRVTTVNWNRAIRWCRHRGRRQDMMASWQLSQVVCRHPITMRLQKVPLAVMSNPDAGMMAACVPNHKALGASVNRRNSLSFCVVLLCSSDTIGAPDDCNAPIWSTLDAIQIDHFVFLSISVVPAIYSARDAGSV